MLEIINWEYFEQAMWFQKIQMFKTKTAAVLLTKQEVKWKVKIIIVTGSQKRVDPYSPPPTASCTNVEDVENIKVRKTLGHLQAIYVL